MFDTGSVSGGSFASPPGSVSEVDYTGSIGLASTLHAGCSMARGDVLNDVVCIPVYDSGHVTSPGAIGCEGSSLLDMSFNSPLCSGMRRSPSAVFARAQRHMHRPPLTPEEAGDIAQVRVRPSWRRVLPVPVARGCLFFKLGLALGARSSLL